jgi:hypothetical protein
VIEDTIGGPSLSTATTVEATLQYKDRNAKDRKILIALSSLSLPERFKRVRELEEALKNAEEDFERKQAVKSRTKKQGTQLVADEDGIIELRYRLSLERAEYWAQKEITPDYVEPVTAPKRLGMR